MSRPRRILIVEDDRDVREMYRQTLLYEGFEVREAVDGWDALRRIDAATPDLIVLDLGLPLVNGEAILRDLATQAPLRDIPVVVVTGSSAPLKDFKVSCILRK